jgi:hypothetical protein
LEENEETDPVTKNSTRAGRQSIQTDINPLNVNPKFVNPQFFNPFVRDRNKLGTRKPAGISPVRPRPRPQPLPSSTPTPTVSVTGSSNSLPRPQSSTTRAPALGFGGGSSNSIGTGATRRPAQTFNRAPTRFQSSSSGGGGAFGGAQILYNNELKNEDGSYNFEYGTDNGIEVKENSVGYGPAKVVEGSYSYVGPDGVTYTVNCNKCSLTTKT